MRYVIVSPNVVNDPFVYNIGQLRCEFMQNAQFVNENNECEKMSIVSFASNRVDYYDWDEKKILDGSWKSVQLFNQIVLPNIRNTLLSVVQDKKQDIVHVDLGKSLLTLYIAYFCVLDKIPLNVSFHMPDPDEEKPVFNIGGENMYSNPRNNLRRYIATKIMQYAMTIFIDNPAIVAVLNRLFPRINRELHIDPLLQIQSIDQQEEVSNA